MPTSATDSPVMPGASKWTVAVCAFAGLAIGLLFFIVGARTYQAEALVAVSNPAGPISDEIAVVTSTGVLDVAETLVGFRPDINVTAAEVASLLTITASADDAEDAAAAANAVADTYVQAQVGAAANVAQRAAVPSDPTGLGPLAYAAIGSLLGALVGLAVSLMQRLRGPKSQQRPSTRITYVPSPSPSAPPPKSDAAIDLPIDMPIASVDPPLDPVSAAGLAAPAEPLFGADPIAASSPTVPLSAPTTAEEAMTTSKPSSFFDAATSDAPSPLVDHTADAELARLSDLERKSIQSRHEAARYELVLAHDQELAHLKVEHERTTAELRAEIVTLNKQIRVQTARLKNSSGTDQSRVGDLVAQVDALEIELADIRQTLEAERIAHTHRLTEERGAADRALDNARREYREELSKHVHTHRQTIADYRRDLDAELAEDRSRHAAALEAQHADYEKQVESERARAQAKIAAASERHERELRALRQTHRQDLDRQSAQHKETITGLRGAGETSESQLRELEKENRLLRAEVATLQKKNRHDETDHAATVQRLSDELTLVKSELDGERQRNAALRADVLRRSAEAHQAIDRAVEERTAQLAELEASVARQRQYADTRVREISAASEEQARQAATREAGLTATVSRLKRELEEAKRKQ